MKREKGGISYFEACQAGWIVGPGATLSVLTCCCVCLNECITDVEHESRKNHRVLNSQGWITSKTSHTSLPGLWLKVASKHLLVHLQLLLSPLLQLQVALLYPSRYFFVLTF